MYVKFINKTQIEYPPKNKGNILNYDLNVEAMIADGYKEFIQIERPTTNRMYHIEYTETEENVIEIIVYDETQEQADARVLENAKQAKINENDIARDIALNQGVTYQNILFDSDTDQKANLMGAIFQMSDADTIPWFGMNNDCLICTKEDLLNIGGLITQLHSFCWNKNAEIKNAINEAETIKEVENIKIDYKGEQ